MEDGPPKKKSRFFLGGKSLINNIQSTFRNRDSTAAAKVPKSEKAFFQTASTASGTSKDADDDGRTDDETGDEPEGDDGSEPETPRSGAVSTTAAALQKLSVSPNARKRWGLGPEELKQLTSEALSPTADDLPRYPPNSIVRASSTNHVPTSNPILFSANVPTTRQPPTPPAGTGVSRRQYQEERQHLVNRDTNGQPATPSSSEPPMQPPHFPDLHLPARNDGQPPAEDPSKPALHHPNPAQPFPLRQNGPIAAGQPPSHPVTKIPATGISNIPLQATLTPKPKARVNGVGYRVPPTAYMSPNRVKKAAAASRKRKRAGIVLPPPAFIYKRTNAPNFNIFPAILLYPEICFHLSVHLSVNSLVALYAISRDFHTILDTRLTTVILSQTLAKAPESSRIFNFRSYRSLCREDPAARIPHPDPVKAKQKEVRLIPSFRWLRMVVWREKAVHELMTIMAEDGVPLPSRCALALKRMWYIMDIPDNARRIGYIHSNVTVPDLDLYFMMCIFVKLDMRFNDPCAQQVHHGLRKLVLAQRGLGFLLRVLKRQELRTQYDILQAWTRVRYTPLPDEAGLSIFGVAAADVGKTKFEYWGKKTAEEVKRPALQVLLRPEQLVMREAVRRGMRFHRHFLRCMLYGYVRPDTLEDYAPRKMHRRDPALLDEYEVGDEVGGEEVPAGTGGEERDELLDLGEPKDVSVLCVEVPGEGDRVDAQAVERRKKEKEFLDKCMKWSRDEREWEGDEMDVD